MKRQGVTLIEMVVVMLLMGLLILSFALSVLPVTEGLLLVRQNVNSAQKSQLALGRLEREFTVITNVVSGGATSMVYDFLDENGIPQRRTVSWTSGQPLKLNGVSLSDDVARFGLQYYAAPGAPVQSVWSGTTRIIEIVLQSQAGGGIVYTNRVFVRNM